MFTTKVKLLIAQTNSFLWFLNKYTKGGTRAVPLTQLSPYQSYSGIQEKKSSRSKAPDGLNAKDQHWRRAAQSSPTFDDGQWVLCFYKPFFHRHYPLTLLCSL